MKLIVRNIMFVLFSISIFYSCDKPEEEKDKPDNIIAFPEIINDWQFDRLVDTETGNILYSSNDINMVYSYSDNNIFQSTENGVPGQAYNYYVTSETRVFENDTLNKLYLYLSGHKVFENYVFLPYTTSLIIVDGDDYTNKSYFKIVEEK